MVLTILEAQVTPGREAALQAAHAAASAQLPPGLVRSELLRDAREATRWRIQTWWASRAALEAMRSAGTPAGVVMFAAAGAEPTLTTYYVVDALPRQATRAEAAGSSPTLRRHRAAAHRLVPVSSPTRRPPRRRRHVKDALGWAAGRSTDLIHRVQEGDGG